MAGLHMVPNDSEKSRENNLLTQIAVFFTHKLCQRNHALSCEEVGYISVISEIILSPYCMN
jgi:hypothetical protein